MELLIQTLGWLGTGVVLLAYFLISSKKLSAESMWYQAMNLFGVIGVGVSVYHQEAWSAFVLQVAWGGIALWALIKMKLKTAQ